MNSDFVGKRWAGHKEIGHQYTLRRKSAGESWGGEIFYSEPVDGRSALLFYVNYHPVTENRKFVGNAVVMLTKKEVIESLKSLPERFDAEMAIEKIVFLEKIRIGLEQSGAGNVVSKEEARKRLGKWLK